MTTTRAPQTLIEQPASSRTSLVLASIAYLLTTIASAFGGFVASIAINDTEGGTRNAWLTSIVMVLWIGAVATIPSVVAVRSLPRRTALTVRLIAVFVSSAVLLMYGALIWFSALIGALGPNDRSASTLLMPLVVLAPLGAAFGVSVLVATALSKRLLWKLLVAWCLLLAVIGVVAVHVRIAWWYGAV